MAKSSILTPVLAGVLGVAVVGSGVAYYNVYVKNSDGKSDGKTDKSKETSTVLSVDQAADNIEKQIEKAQKLANGELDGGYKGTITYTPPTDGELGQMGIKTFTVGAEAKQKDKMSGMDYTFQYDSKNLLTVDLVVDNEAGNAYVKIPELSDAYLYGTTEEIENWISSSMGNSGYSSYDSVTGLMDETPTLDTQTSFEASSFDADASDYSAMAITDGDTMPVPDSSGTAPDLSKLEDIDFTEIFDDLATYVDTVKENAPSPADADDYTVTSGDQSITLTTKRYTITAEDADKIAKAIADKGKTDETLKKLFDAMGMSDEDYAAMWTQMDEEYPAGESEDDSTVTLDVYYNGEEVQGFKALQSNLPDEQIYGIWASDKDKLIVDCLFDTDQNIKMTGLVTNDNGALNGSIKMEATSSYTGLDGAETNSTLEMSVDFNELTATDDSLNGGLGFTMKEDDETYEMNFVFKSDDGSSTITVTGNLAGSSIGTLEVSSQSTDASDITIPTGTGYNITNEEELNKYIEGCDAEGLMNSVKDALGEELYNQMFGAATGGSMDMDVPTDEYSTDTYAMEDFDIGA